MLAGVLGIALKGARPFSRPLQVGVLSAPFVFSRAQVSAFSTADATPPPPTELLNARVLNAPLSLTRSQVDTLATGDA